MISSSKIQILTFAPLKQTVKRNHPMLKAGNPGKSRDVCDHPALFLTNNHAILKCLLASYSTVGMQLKSEA